jgi:hypothetical protein
MTRNSSFVLCEKETFISLGICEDTADLLCIFSRLNENFANSLGFVCKAQSEVTVAIQRTQKSACTV